MRKIADYHIIIGLTFLILIIQYVERIFGDGNWGMFFNIIKTIAFFLLIIYYGKQSFGAGKKARWLNLLMVAVMLVGFVASLVMLFR